MKLSKVCVLCATLTGLALTSCNLNGNGSGNGGKDPKEVQVFVLSGQSNMEGSTYWTHPTSNTPLLENYFDDNNMDFSIVRDGIDNVLTSYYGFYHPNGWTQAHTASTRSGNH